MRDINLTQHTDKIAIRGLLGSRLIISLIVAVFLTAIVVCLAWVVVQPLQVSQIALADEKIADNSLVIATTDSDKHTLWLGVTADYNGLLTDAKREISQRGWVHLQTLLTKIRQQSPNDLILLDAGDGLFGSSSSVLPEESLRDKPPADKYGNLPAVQLMNYASWDAMAIGNYDLNSPHLEEAYLASDFAWLAANALNPQGEPVFRPYVVIRRGSFSVGVIGFGQPGLKASAAEWRGPWQMGSIQEGLHRWVPHLRKVEKVDLVIALMHSGADPFYGWEGAATENKPLPSVAGLVAWKWKLPSKAWPDLVLSGGSHRMSYVRRNYSQLRWKIPTQPIPLLQVGSSGRGLMLVKIQFQPHSNYTKSRTPPKISAAAVALPALSNSQALAIMPPYARKRFQVAQDYLNTPTDWHFIVTDLLKRHRRPFARCLANIQYQALGYRLQQNSPTASPPLSLLPLPHKLYFPQANLLNKPILRKQLYNWFYYPDDIVQISLQAKQMALLLKGMVRWNNNYSTRGLLPLAPGGFEFQQEKKDKAKTSNIQALIAQPAGTPLKWRSKYLVWSTEFIRQGHNPVATQALLDKPDRQQQLDLSLRELVFQYMKNENQPPKKCKRFLAN